MSTRVDGIIEVTGMTRRYGSGRGAFEAVSDLSLSVEEGELFGLLGTAIVTITFLPALTALVLSLFRKRT